MGLIGSILAIITLPVWRLARLACIIRIFHCMQVNGKRNKRWVWIALCRRTRQIVTYYVGDRSKDSCRELYNRIPEPYKTCLSFSDYWKSYETVFGTETHQSVGKEIGETAHVECWNNSLRQRLARFVRKTLSFLKSELMHDFVLKLFILQYNLDRLEKIS